MEKDIADGFYVIDLHISSHVDALSEQDVIDIAAKLKKLADIKDRSHHFKSRPKCFIGSEFVDLIVANVPKVDSRDYAVELGNRMIDYGIIENAVQDHPFRDGNFLYHYLSDIDNGVLNMSRLWNQPITLPVEYITISPPTESSLTVDLSVYLITLAMKLYQKHPDAILSLDADAIKNTAEYRKFETITCQLQNADLDSMPPSERLVFWLNVHHTLLLHSHLYHGLTNTAFRSMAFFKTSYKIGRHKFALLEIEHSMLRGALCSPSGFGLGQILVPHLAKISANEERSAWSLKEFEPRINFVSSVLAASSPTIRIYKSETILTMLEGASHKFLEDEIEVVDNNIRLPAVLSWYYKDFCYDFEKEKVKMVTRLLRNMKMGGKREAIRSMLENTKTNISFKKFDWTFTVRLSGEELKPKS